MKTPATRFLDEHDVRYTEHVYEYAKHGAPPCLRSRSACRSTRWHGLLVRITPLELSRILGLFAVSVAIKD